MGDSLTGIVAEGTQAEGLVTLYFFLRSGHMADELSCQRRADDLPPSAVKCDS